MRKTFTYGDFWPVSDEHNVIVREGPETVIQPSDMTANRSILQFLKNHRYQIVLDPALDTIAVTDVQQRKISLNANYDESVLRAAFMHEMGHLVVFNVHQFSSIHPATYRSIISKYIYTYDHVITYGMPTLLSIENIVQDIVIETISDHCVCEELYRSLGYRLGVKHASSLDALSVVTKETLHHLLPDPDHQPDMAMTASTVDRVASAVDSLTRDLQADMDSITDAIQNQEDSHALTARIIARNAKDPYNANGKPREDPRPNIDHENMLIQRLSNQLEGLKDLQDSEPDEERAEAIKEITDTLDQMTSKEHRNALEQDWEDKYQKNIDRLRESLEKDRELLDAIKRSWEHDQQDLLDKDANQSMENDTGESSGKPYLHDQQEQFWDIHLPAPITGTRDELRDHESIVISPRAKLNIRKIRMYDNDNDQMLGGMKRRPEHEYTYFKPNKKEITPQDMLKGSRKLRSTGVNVLIGLDVSGSMTNIWINDYERIRDIVLRLKDRLNITNVHYFTYTESIGSHSDHYEDLSIVPGGGNAFGSVYQEVMQRCPVGMRNEIIIVTDCKDTLGFKLNQACEMVRNGRPIHTHISVIDTENTGYYDRSNLEDRDWRIVASNNDQLPDIIESSLEENIDYDV
jgi:flagellar motility protein MotE (MotC chaperone)